MRIKTAAALRKTGDFLRSPQGETLRYIFIGGCTTLVDYISYEIMVLLLGLNVNVSNLISTVLAILFAYVTNKFVVFVSRTTSVQELVTEFLKFIVSRLFTMVLELGGVYLLVSVLGQNKSLGKAEIIVLVIIVNYVLSKLFVFKKRAKDEA